jgi:hypothetical protein
MRAAVPMPDGGQTVGQPCSESQIRLEGRQGRRSAHQGAGTDAGGASASPHDRPGTPYGGNRLLLALGSPPQHATQKRDRREITTQP